MMKSLDEYLDEEREKGANMEEEKEQLYLNKVCILIIIDLLHQIDLFFIKTRQDNPQLDRNQCHLRAAIHRHIACLKEILKCPPNIKS